MKASIRKQIGSALWLWELLVNLIPGEWDGKSYVFVAGGQVLSDKQLGIWLDVKPSTIGAWRRRLKAAGLVDDLIKPGVGRVYVASPLVELFGTENSQSTQVERPQAVACRPGTDPLASRFVQ